MKSSFYDAILADRHVEAIFSVTLLNKVSRRALLPEMKWMSIFAFVDLVPEWRTQQSDWQTGWIAGCRVWHVTSVNSQHVPTLMSTLRVADDVSSDDGAVVSSDNLAAVFCDNKAIWQHSE